MGLLPLFLATLVLLSPSEPARAAIFHVTKTADTFDGACDGDCSLREAVRAADDVYPEAHTIRVPAGTYTLTIPGAGENGDATGDLDVATNVTFVGAGRDTTVVDGGGLDRVFHLFLPTDRRQDIAFKHLTIRGGDVTGAPDSSGGGIRLDGNPNLRVRVFDCAIRDNKGFRSGGALNAFASLTITDSVVSGNSAVERGGGLDLQGGNLLRRALIEDNTAGEGGGVAALGAVTIEDSLLCGNQANFGGAVSGGGLGALVIRNTTISGNAANTAGALGVGGGLVEHATVADNAGGATWVYNFGVLQLRSTLISGDACGASAPSGVVLPTSLGHNLETADTCGLADPTDRPSAGDAKLAELADNGGPTETRALLSGSPAVDAGDPAACPEADQRGLPREAGACDIGAYEAGAPATPVCGTADLQEIVEDFSLRSVGCVVVGLERTAGVL